MFSIKMNESQKESSCMNSISTFIIVIVHNLISIMEEQNPPQPREKIMTYLHRCYSTALLHLKQGKLAEGTEQLQSILLHEFMSDTDMENLKYSALMSLAHIQEQTHSNQQALAKYWEALQILANRSANTLQKGLINLKQFNQERSHSEFTILLKMLAICQKDRLVDQTIYILKRAITISPLIWRQNLLFQLRDIYQAQNRHEALKDINLLIKDKKKLEEVLASNIIPEKETENRIQNASDAPNIDESYAKKLTLKLNLIQKQQHKLKYSCWEQLLTMMYVLLKCHAQRGFNKKKYKKIEESKEWTTLIKEFHPLRTTIEIILVQEDESEKKMELEGITDKQDCPIVNDLATQILKAQFIKKKPRKTINPLEELTRNPSINSKDPKKQSITQTKSIYASIGEYYKDIFAKSGFKRQLLTVVKFLDEAKFNEILGKLSSNESDPLESKKDDDMDDEEEQKSANAQDKQGTKEKKTLKAKKIQKIAHHQMLNNQLKFAYFQNDCSLRFNNIYEAVEHITYFLINNKIVSNESKILANSSIKKCLLKNILKVIQSTTGFFSELIHLPSSQNEASLQFLDILLQKLEQLIEKDYKNKPFKQHQQSKKQILIAYIRKHFTISTPQIKHALQVKDIPLEKLWHYSILCQQFVRLHHVYGFVRPSEVSYYRKLFIAFRKKMEKVSNENEQKLEKKITDIIDRQIEKHQKKISCKSSLLSITEESQEKQTHNIDEIFKKDQMLASALPLLKDFSCFNIENKAKNPSEMVQQVNGKMYLESFIKISQIFFKKVESESMKEFNSRLLFLIADLMKIKQVIGQIYERIMHSTSVKTYELKPEIFAPVLYHLLRFYLLNLYEQNDNCIRVMFYISNIIFRSESEQSKFIVIPKCIYLFDQLIKFKKFKPDLVNIIRKKYYQNLILKNLYYIYQSPLLKVHQNQNEDSKKKKQRKNSSKSQSSDKCMEDIKNIHDESLQLKQKVYDILHQIYFCNDKEREFNPKKIDEAVGYFMYLLRAFHKQFYCPAVELEYEVIKIIKKCYKIYSQKRNEVFEYCPKFKSFKTLFDAIMNGEEEANSKQQLISIIKRQQSICDCCKNVRQKFPFYVESLFVLGKFFESQSQKDDITVDKQQWIQDLDKDESYYFQYLSLNLDSEIAWENIIRVNANKSYLYFDSLMIEPIENYKGKFLYTKRIILYVNEYLSSFKKIVDYGNQKSQILNALKIKQREYFSLVKEIQTRQTPWDRRDYKEFKDLTKKYKEGLKKIWQMQQKINFDDVKIRYIRTIEVKMKLFWLNVQTEKDQKKEEAIEIGKDEQCQSELPLVKPSKRIGQMAEILADIHLIINDLPAEEEKDYVIHLEEDLVVEAYMFLYNNVDEMLQKMLTNLCKSIQSKTQLERNQFQQEALLSFNDLGCTLAFFQQKVLSNNQKYRIKVQNINSDEAELKNCLGLFEALLVKNIQSKAKPIEARIRSIERIKQKKSVIIINDDDKMQQEILEPNIIKKSISECQQSKEVAKNKEIIIDIAKYCIQKMKKIQRTAATFKYLNKLKKFLTSPLFIENIQKTSKILTQLMKFYMQLPKYQTTKRYKNRRSVGNGLLQCSMIALKYGQLPDKANQIIKDMYNLKNDEIVAINIYNDKIQTEKNELLSEYYNRVLVHQIMKIKYIEHIFRIYEAQGNKQGLIALIRKLLKLSKNTDKEATKIEKEKEKEKQKEKEKEKEKQKQKQKQKINEVINVDIEEQKQEGEQPQEEKQIQKEKKAKQLKQRDEKQHEIRCYFALYCFGTSIFVDMMLKESTLQPLDEKYEKNLIQFKNRIRKWIGKDSNNDYLNKIEGFIAFYQKKFNRTVKMKRAKKNKQEQENQKQEEVVQPVEPVQTKPGKVKKSKKC